jgi:autotransporter translocation and assembly factor TamB
MNMKWTKSVILLFAAGIVSLALHTGAQQSQTGQSQPAQSTAPKKQDSMPGMDMDDMQHDAAKNPDAAKSANDAMSGHDMEMNGHMYMTDLRPENAADDERAAEIVTTLQTSIAQYKDYKVALADGFKIFHPEFPQEHYHFTNYSYALKAQFIFDPEHPTSLLYKKTKDGYELEGAMFTARKRATEDELNERVPLSVARWHKHVNFCAQPVGVSIEQADWKKFGLRGSIVTEEACNEAGGRWHAQVFGWMVHVYPYESDPAKIWAH